MTLTVETPESIIGRLAVYAPIFHACMRHAIAAARDVFAERDGLRRPFDPWLFAYHVRWELKQALEERLPPGTPVSVEQNTIMCSVVLRIEDIEVRVRKSEAGDVPPPGQSGRMQGWYAQTLDGGVSHNILMLWHVDDQLEYVSLDIAFPYDGTAYAPLVRWMVSLPETVGTADDLDITVPPAAASMPRRGTSNAPQ